VGNAYLESFTKEKVYIIAGPKFGDRQGHTLVIVKALYDLKSSGLRWRERFANVLKEMGFSASRAEPDIWMRDKGDHYEYIAVYVDDLLIASQEPNEIVKILEEIHKFKLKGSVPTSLHLGCDFFRDEDGVLCYALKTYILHMLDTFERLFGKQPKQYVAPLEGADHPELDDLELLEIEDIKVYQSLIGALQWVIQIGRFDITTHVMTLSRLRAAPSQGHLDRVKRIYGYLSKMRHGVIRICTKLPDYSVIPEKTYDWDYTCYEGAEELIPSDMLRPLGKEVQTTTFVDANLYHDLISGRLVTGILHLLNKTPIDWFSKLRSTVETATFGSKYVANT
jgi:Reverse transcriptase (RNA-dependent DNA polymerase)